MLEIGCFWVKVTPVFGDFVRVLYIVHKNMGARFSGGIRAVWEGGSSGCQSAHFWIG